MPFQLAATSAFGPRAPPRSPRSWAERRHGNSQVLGIELLIESMEGRFGDAIPGNGSPAVVEPTQLMVNEFQPVGDSNG